VHPGKKLTKQESQAAADINSGVGDAALLRRERLLDAQGEIVSVCLTG
jgi:hypothetical protein